VNVQPIMNADLQNLGRRLIGRWTTEATHPGLPGAVVRGSSDIEWFEGERFLIYRSHYDHPDIPDSISIIGDTDGLRMHYFDSCGVHRVLEVVVSDEGWEMAMDRHTHRPGRSRRPNPLLTAHDVDLRGQRPDDVGEGEAVVRQLTWNDDLEITYRRAL
jgi:hypothetical protein